MNFETKIIFPDITITAEKEEAEHFKAVASLLGQLVDFFDEKRRQGYDTLVFSGGRLEDSSYSLLKCENLFEEIIPILGDFANQYNPNTFLAKRHFD